MASPNGGNEIGTSIVSRAARAVAGVVRDTTGAFSGWFGPQAPIPPVAPESVAGRQWDYAYGINLTYQPRNEPGQASIDFPTLRRLAEPSEGGLDMLRLAIETRKDQMQAQGWTIRSRNAEDDGGARAREWERMFRRPDGITPFRVWMRQLVEDHLIIDAVAIYPRELNGRMLFEIVDAATLKRIVDNAGRVPPPPIPAYEQVLKGLPAVEYTTKEIGYYPYNLRSNRLYGMSRVEQVLGIVNIALNRQLSVLNYFTEGTVPDALVGVPESWNPDQIKQYQDYFDAMLSGQLGERRKMRFVPGGTNITFSKPEILKNDFDEWLARIISYCFSLSPEGLVKQTNRATAETAHIAAKEEGLEPLKLWFKDLIDDLLDRGGSPDLEFVFEDEEIVSPLTKAQVIQIYTGNKAIIDVNEARSMAGLPPASPEQLDAMRPPSPPSFPGSPQRAIGAGEGAKGKPEGEGAGNANVGPGDVDVARLYRGTDSAPVTTLTDNVMVNRKVEKHSAGRSLPPLQRNDKLDERTLRRIRRGAAGALAGVRRSAVAAAKAGKASPGAAKLAKDGTVGDDDLDRILAGLTPEQWARLKDAIETAAGEFASERASASLYALEDLTTGDFEAMLEQANREAVAWAADRAAELVTDVSDTTIAGIREIVTGAIADGLTNDELADELSTAYEFSDTRAILIARTETSFAENAGTLIGWRASGVVTGKIWLIADAEVCPECEALDGVEVPLDEDFPLEGGDGPPLHPNCRCTTAPVVIDRSDEGGGDEEAA